MPIYEYVCASCGHRTDILHGVHESGPHFCPECGAEGAMRKAIAAPAVHFKGSGWAKKDRAAAASSKGKRDDGGGDKAAAGPSSEDGGDKAASVSSRAADAGESTAGGSTSGGSTSGGSTSGGSTSGGGTSADSGGSGPSDKAG